METELAEAPIPPVLADLLDDPAAIFDGDRAPFDEFGSETVDRFRMAAARRYLNRSAAAIPAVADMLGGTDPASIAELNDLVPFLFAEDAYKSYDPAWLSAQDFTAMTRWIARYTSNDYSKVDMDGCTTISEWCQRLLDQTGDLVCHSSGTSGTLSFVPRSQHDIDLFAMALMWNFQPQEPGGTRRFLPGQPNDITMFSPSPRRMFRITSGIYDSLERVFQTPPVQAFMITQAPEFAIAQGRMRLAGRNEPVGSLRDDPLVAEWRERVELYQAELPLRLAEWTTRLIERFQGRRIIFQGSFDMAWNLAAEMRSRGISGAFTPDSIFSVIGGVKDGSVLPEDWADQFQEIVGVAPDSFSVGWGMSEINGGLRQCPAGHLHFDPHVIPFLLKPGTREPLPRNGVRHGQLAMLEMVSRHNWGGMISGDSATVDWDSRCACGRRGPLMAPGGIRRI